MLKNSHSDHPQKNHSINLKILMIFFAIMLGFFGYLLFSSFSKSPQTNYGKYFFRSHLEAQKKAWLASLKHLFSLQEVREFVTPPPKSLITASQNQWSSYTLWALDPQTGEKQRTAFVNAYEFYDEPFQFSDNQLFYINQSGEMSRLFLDSGKYEHIKIPDISIKYESPNKIWDFLFSHGQIVYLKGGCSEGEDCSLWVYNLATSKNQVIIDTLKTSALSGIRLKDIPSKDTVRILNGWGDAGLASVTLHEVNLKQKTIRAIDSAEFNASCDFVPNSPDCGKETLLQNQKYNTITQKKPIHCHGATITFNAGGEFGTVDMIKGKNFEMDLEGQYVGCLE